MIVQNDQQAQKLNAQIGIVTCDNNNNNNNDNNHRPPYALRIDSSNFDSNNLLEQSELEVSTWLEIKYTNKQATECNQCHVFKIQLVVRFSQTVYFSLKNLVDLDAEKFLMTLFVRNLSKSSILLKSATTTTASTNVDNADRTITIDENGEYEFEVEMNKLRLTSLNQIDNDPVAVACVNEAINDHLRLAYTTASAAVAAKSVLKFNSQSQLFRKYYVQMFSCPIELSAHRAIRVMSDSSHSTKLHTLMLVAKSRLVSDVSSSSSGKLVRISWKFNNLNYSIVSKNKEWLIRVTIRNYFFS